MNQIAIHGGYFANGTPQLKSPINIDMVITCYNLKQNLSSLVIIVYQRCYPIRNMLVPNRFSHCLDVDQFSNHDDFHRLIAGALVPRSDVFITKDGNSNIFGTSMDDWYDWYNW